MMLRAVIRRASSRGSSASSGLAKSLKSSRVAASSQSFHSLSATELLPSSFLSRVFRVLEVRDLSFVLFMRRIKSPTYFYSYEVYINLRRTLLTSFQGTTLQRWVRPFSSDSGDVVEAVVPHMGESITDGTLANFLKQPGDRVEADEAIAQIETDKVTIDIASPASGVIQEFLVKEGDTVEPGNKVAIISKSADSVSHVAPSEKIPEKAAPKPSPAEEPKVESTKVAEKPKASSPPPPPTKQSAKEPQLPPKDRERRVPMTRLRKRVATRLKDSQNTFALLTTFNEIDMTNLMKLRSQYKDAFFEKHGVKLGLMSGFIKAAVSALQAQPVVNAVIDGDDIIYRDYIDISIAVGTSKGLVVPVIRGADQMNFADIEKTINSLAKKANEGTISIDEMAGGSFTVSNGGVYGSLISTPIINPPQSAILGMHSIVQRPMVVGGSVVPRPMMYVALTYDHRLIDGREAVYFLRRIKDVAAVSALQAQPVVNAVIDGDDIIYRDYIDISIAVGTSKGLVVPVIRGADQMNFADIEKTINSLAKKANEGTISIDEMAGGSFTVSNGGVYGSLISTPIINPPQSAILGMHSIVQRPMVVGGSVVPRPMMYVALTYDHRLIDGREAVYFLRRIKDVVEDPQRLLLDI
ncbi:hypothetical protein DY000_02017164 [Brassica cretica]|uniref:dihydrolipoyllysine-residue succinyltransferase n=1 Tax=Brassica cretica TaxID=69181 RepID=A0ABQ7D4J8_BRACR|nr:hypothetical protein DY000_02017164 [Brassica cretica]